MKSLKKLLILTLVAITLVTGTTAVFAADDDVPFPKIHINVLDK